MRRKAFTLSELLVAMGLMVALLAGAGVVFRSAVQSQRTSIALSELMRKFRGITDQLDSDFRGLRKDGEIAIFWSASTDGSERFDRLMFFADGDFQTYNEQPMTPGPPLKRIAGNLARVCYMLAKDGSGVYPQNQIKAERILSRTQHILTGDASFDALPLLGSLFNASLFRTHNFANEYDSSYGDLLSWKNIDITDKYDMLSIITGIRISTSAIVDGGAMVDYGKSSDMHMFLGEGVSQFKVQSWYDADGRWFPEVDRNGDGDFTDGDFFLAGSLIDTANIPGVIYPGNVIWNDPVNSPVAVDETNFLTAPGLGRALKFTFTLYDSRGIYPDGKTFTHIVWLGN